MHRIDEDTLLMIWSNACESGYCVGIARSNNGEIDGEWIQEDELLFSKQKAGVHDGGHGMIFTDKDGQTYLIIHSPNKPTQEHGEKTVIIPVCEENGTLVWKKTI